MDRYPGLTNVSLSEAEDGQFRYWAKYDAVRDLDDLGGGGFTMSRFETAAEREYFLRAESWRALYIKEHAIVSALMADVRVEDTGDEDDE